MRKALGDRCMTRILFDAAICHTRKTGLLSYIKYEHINLPLDVYVSQLETPD
jgi:hypothetical protein